MSISYQQPCLMWLMNLFFGAGSLQHLPGLAALGVCVYLILSILFDFTNQPVPWCWISTGYSCMCLFDTINSVWFHQPTCTLVLDLYRLVYVSILYHQFCLISLTNLCIGVGSLQIVCVHFIPSILFDFTSQPVLWCWISTGYWRSSCC